MHTLQAIIVGIVQGLSEFLPISSSAHIVFSSAIYKLLTGINLPQTASGEEVFFDIAIHLATLVAVFIFFWKDIVDITKAFFSGLKNKNYSEPDFKTALYILISTIITGALALIIKDFAHSLVANPKLVSLFLIITGFVLFFSEKFKKGSGEINLKNVIFIAIAQGLAVFPGLSRSGLTIATAVFQGVDRTRAARFSFLISVPIIILASMLYPLFELDFAQIQAFNFKAIIFGMLAALVSGYLCIKYFMRFLERSTLKSFAYYCWVAGVLMFVLFSLCHRL